MVEIKLQEPQIQRPESYYFSRNSYKKEKQIRLRQQILLIDNNHKAYLQGK